MKIVYCSKDIPFIVKKHFLPLLHRYTIFTFEGSLGTGKTTLIKELLLQAGVEDVVTSPTFNYVNSYRGRSGKVFNHFDLYRLDELNDFLETGFDEYLYKSDEINLIEWPAIIVPLLWKKPLCNRTISISLDYVEETEECRTLLIEGLKGCSSSE